MGFQIGFKDIVDIFLVAVLLYQMFKLLKRSGAVNIFVGILAFIICWFLVSYVFKMELLGGIFDRVVSVGAFALLFSFRMKYDVFSQESVLQRNGVFLILLNAFLAIIVTIRKKPILIWSKLYLLVVIYLKAQLVV